MFPKPRKKGGPRIEDRQHQRNQETLAQARNVSTWYRRHAEKRKGRE
jgi:hypothetical protein